VCCGTKRLTEIQCPPDCGYLAAAREHPAAVVRRQQGRDIALFATLVGDLNERQSQLFWLLNASILRYRPPEFQMLLDDDVADAVAAMASTCETSSRGVIYEHRAATVAAERLAAALNPVVAEAVGRGGSAYERDAAVVLRRIADGVARARAIEAGGRRAYLETLARALGRGERAEPISADAIDQPRRLIVP
jgi:hypothetical protein